MDICTAFSGTAADVTNIAKVKTSHVYKVIFAHAFVALLYFAVGSIFAVMDLTLSPGYIRFGLRMSLT